MAAALDAAPDWSQTALGAVDTWPRSLRAYVDMILAMPTPAIIFWGADQLQIYNAAYAVIMGPRHPRYFCAPYRECWPDTYAEIMPHMRAVLDRGETWSVDRARFTLTRHGYLEEAYFTFTFSPLFDDRGAIAGIFQPVVEVTQAVLEERRADVLRSLSPRVDASADGGHDAAAIVAAFAADLEDLPFALVYTVDEAHARPQLVASTLGGERALAPLDALVGRAIAEGIAVEIEDLRAVLPAAIDSPWGEPVLRGLVLPIANAGDRQPLGAVVLGMSPRLPFDAAYRTFLDDIARQLAIYFVTARARRRDRALHARERAARREAELQKAHLSELFMQAPAAIVVCRGADHIVELANPTGCQVLGRGEAALVGRPLFETVPEAVTQGFKAVCDKVYITGESFVGGPVRARFGGPAGTAMREYHFLVVYAPLRDANGAVEGLMGMGLDCTSEVHARAQLEELRRVAEDANRAKDQFLAMLGHELRNPLAPIVTTLELLRTGRVAEPSRLYEIIDRQTRHMIRIVDDLLDISRIASGKIELKKARVELAQLIAEAVDLARPLTAKNEQSVVVWRVPVHGLPVVVDPHRMVQVLSNLLSNAAKYSSKKSQIEVTAERVDHEVRVRVRDHGIGIDRAMLPHVFDMFVQAPQTLDRAQGGLGLGLAIVKSLVELHGGTVEAHSDGPHRGSEFVLSLPLAIEHAHAALPAAGTTPEPLRRRVLVVDDNEDAAETLAEWLGAQGCTTRTAYDGPEALRVARSFHPDLALLDIGLPVMDGFELARRLREQERDLRLIAISGYGQFADRQRSEAAGFETLLVKPVDVSKLRGLIDEHRHDG